MAKTSMWNVSILNQFPIEPAVALATLPLFRPLSTRSNGPLQKLWADLGHQHYLHGNRNAGTRPLKTSITDFTVNVAQFTNGSMVVWCAYCNMPSWQHLTTNVDQQWICPLCTKSYVKTCGVCGDLHATTALQRYPDKDWYTGGRRVPGHDQYLWACHGCTKAFETCRLCDYKVPSEDLVVVQLSTCCLQCRERNYRFCQHCNDWQNRDHRHRCTCEAENQAFTFITTSGNIDNDSITDITLPKGTIDDVGIAQIKHAIRQVRGRDAIVDDIESVWITKTGTYTKRLAKAMYKDGFKASEALLNTIGNVAAEHTAKETAYKVDFTRQLNQSADYFAYAGSCWWTDFAWSRCALKSAGGFGMRFHSLNLPLSRSWVLPVTAGKRPNFDINAPAYILFNSYGPISATTQARILAQLTGKSYKKVEFSARTKFEINSEVGYLVAAPAVCAKTNAIRTMPFKMKCPTLLPTAAEMDG